MNDAKLFFHSLKILEVLSNDNDLKEYIDRETRLNILKEGSKAPPQLIIKAVINIIMDDIVGNTLPKCSYPQNEECSIRDITLSTLKALSVYGITDANWIFPFIEAAICKLMENNSKRENENIVVEYINRAPVKNINPRSLLRKNQALKRRYY